MERTLDRLGDDIASLSADIQAATCRWLTLVAEFDRRSGWADQGCRNCAHWLSWRCGIGPEAAREHVRVARRLDELPTIREAFARAELSYSKVRAITRVEGIENEAELVELAHCSTAAQLERLVRAYRGVVRTELGAREQLRNRFLKLEWEEDGCLRSRGRLPAEQGAILLRAVETIYEELQAGVSAETDHSDDAPDCAGPDDTATARRADALVHLADTALAASAATSSGGDRFQVVIHVDAATLAGTDDSGRSELADGPFVSHEVARRLACDASVVRIVERDGKPLSVGRKSRSIPPALRRALRSRDGGCQFPGCGQTRHVDAHHVHHWAHGGATDLNNLVELCRHHHRLIHEGAFSIAGRPGAQLVFTTPSGRRLRSTPPRTRYACDLRRVSAETPDRPYEPMDLGRAVDAMLAVAPIRGSGDAGRREASPQLVGAEP